MPDLSEEETARFLNAWLKLRQIVQAANFNRFHQAGLSATQFMTLNLIPDTGFTLSELARQLNPSPATLNQTVNSLEERGLVLRSRSTKDARKIDIRATAAGQQLQNTASEDVHGWVAGLFAQMTAKERTGLLAGLERMGKLGEQGDPPQPLTLRARAAPRASRSSPRSPRG